MYYDNYIAVSYKGRRYMCVDGSKRADALARANRAWMMGYEGLAQELFSEALNSEGCAFEHRSKSVRG